jgi:hypothetical protein
MTTEHVASRTLVKSPPELWAECSDADSLGRHLSESFGEIRITRLEPETAVAWEGEHVSGTVKIEPSAWGTRVTLTAQTPEDAVEPEPLPEEPVVEEPAATEEAAPEEPVAEEPAVEEPVAEEPVAIEEAPPAQAESPAPKLGLMARMRRLFKSEAQAEIALAAEPSEPDPSTEPERVEEIATVAQEPEPEVDPVPSEPVQTDPIQPASELEASVAPGVEDSAGSASSLDAEAALSAALDSLGQAHHRPFSRA